MPVEDAWFEAYLATDEIDRDDAHGYTTAIFNADHSERDYAEEEYWRERCPECESRHDRTMPCDSYAFHIHLPEEMAYHGYSGEPTPKPMSRKELAVSGAVVGTIFAVVLVALAIAGYALLVLHYGPAVIGRG
jgi:hypothetical protein